MVSKKDALILGVLAIGGVGIASMALDSDSGGSAKGGGILGRFPGITQGTPSYAGEGTTVYNIPAEAGVSFPAPQTFDISKFFTTPPTPDPVSASSGVSSGGKKVVTYGELSKAYDAYYGTYVSKGYVAGDIAFERGKREEIENLMALEAHPTLMHDPTGKIVRRSGGGSKKSSRVTSAAQRASNIASHAAGLSGTKKRSYLSASAAQAKARGE